MDFVDGWAVQPCDRSAGPAEEDVGDRGPLVIVGVLVDVEDHLPGGAQLHPVEVAEGHDGVQAGQVKAVGVAVVAWLFLFRTYAGFQLAVGGQAPRAARYAGFSARRALWTALLGSGGLAGLAGALEVTGPHRDHVIAFARRHGRDAAITVVAKLFAPLSQGGRAWPRAEAFDGALNLGDYSAEDSDGEKLASQASLTTLFRHLPVAVLKASVKTSVKSGRKRRHN